MKCLIWRQHRGQALWTALTLTALCALMLAVGLSTSHWLTGYHHWLRALAAAGCPPPNARSGDFHVRSAAACSALRGQYPGGLQAAFAARYGFAILAFKDGIPAALAVIGALIGAPLVAREIEQRTQLAAWTQSVSRQRWYATKTAAIASGLAVAGLAAGFLNDWLQHPSPKAAHRLALGLVRLHQPGPGRRGRPGLRAGRRPRRLAAAHPAGHRGRPGRLPGPAARGVVGGRCGRTRR